MKRELLILRHGKSDWSKPVADFDRPLKKRGRKNAERVGKWMCEQQLVPDYVVSSPAVRAWETARLTCTAMGISLKDIHQDDAAYEAGQAQLLQILREAPKPTRRFLLVGHNTGMEDLVLYLAGGTAPCPEDGKLMPTAAVARFIVRGAWAGLDTGSAELLHILRPGELQVR
jgi:phosphohistidine phosphatase